MWIEELCIARRQLTEKNEIVISEAVTNEKKLIHCVQAYIDCFETLC